MDSGSADVTTYQYPDPDDLEDGKKFAWVGDENDHVPEALRQTLSTGWLNYGSEYDDDGPSTLDQTRFRENEESMSQTIEDAVEVEHGETHLDGSDEELRVDSQSGDPQLLTNQGPRAAAITLTNRQSRSHNASNPSSGRARRGGLGRGNRGIKRGPRNPVEPEPEFKVLHSQATMAFIANDYDNAENLTLQALQINPEMYPAHSLLSQIHAARGDLDKAITAAYSGAHTQPRNTEMWSRIAQMVLDRDRKHTTATLKDAIYCYSRVISIDKSNLDARFQRATLNREIGRFKQVVTEYELLYKYLPYDTTVLRHLAQASLETNEPDRVLKLYKAAIAHFQDLEPHAPTSFTWSDVNVLVELYLFRGDFEEGLKLTKALSRWLLGRRGERFWEEFTEDDREWDLNDDPRRIECSGFQPNQYEAKTYGAGLPLDLRMKLGILRLGLGDGHADEAISHFEWLLDPADHEKGAKVLDYPDLFRDVARLLMEKGLHHDAIRFYEPLQQAVDYVDISCGLELARCYILVGRIADGEALQASTRELNEDNDDEDYDENNSTESDIVPRKSFTTARIRVTKRPKKRLQKQKENLEYLQDLFKQWQSLKGSLQGQMHVKVQWTDVTQRLVRRFMQEKAFFPDARNRQHLDFTQQARHFVKRKPREKDSSMDPQSALDAETDNPMRSGMFAGIGFDDWLEVFLEYGLSLAYDGKSSQAYEVIASATQANVFNDSSDSLFLIHVCWFTCALLNNDDETLCSVCRWFMKECQFVTDAYRLFSVLNRFCDSDKGWFHSGPSQKHILRQIKAMDFSLAGDARPRNNQQERSAYTAVDHEGNTILPQNMDVSLLMLYGHTLYAGKSYAYANNYFLRALSVDTDNSMVKLSLALGYIHHALKRQADNRHQLIMQGFAYLLEYYNRREHEGGVSEKQEAAYNVARAFHLLGLTHIAIPYYEQCLALSKAVQDMCKNIIFEDFAQEAAFALQGIWAANGNEEKAFMITEQWLQIT